MIGDAFHLNHVINLTLYTTPIDWISCLKVINTVAVREIPIERVCSRLLPVEEPVIKEPNHVPIVLVINFLLAAYFNQWHWSCCWCCGSTFCCGGGLWLLMFFHMSRVVVHRMIGTVGSVERDLKNTAISKLLYGLKLIWVCQTSIESTFRIACFFGC